MKFVFVESWPPSQILNFFTNIFFVSKERVKIQIIKRSKCYMKRMSLVSWLHSKKEWDVVNQVVLQEKDFLCEDKFIEK